MQRAAHQANDKAVGQKKKQALICGASQMQDHTPDSTSGMLLRHMLDQT
jgi:hypothetical protein